MTAVPERIGRFKIIRLLGQGGMGMLYLAEDPRLERPVAIKLLKEDSAELRGRFADEARMAAGLRHVNIVSIFDVDDYQGHPFIAMEYIPGEALAEMVRRHAPLGLARRLQMMEDLCAGLAFAHRAGIIHRDIKPANIMIDADGTLKILDFGIARLGGGGGKTQAGVVIGTLNYMSPEQVSARPIDTRSDIFAVGAVFYELLTYRQAFPGELPEVFTRILHREPEPVEGLVPNLDPEVARIVRRALQKDVAKRYQDLADLRRELTPVRLRIAASEPPCATVIIGAGKTVVLPSAGVHNRAEQIAALIASARAALEAGNFSAARASVDEAIALESGNAEARELSVRIRAREAEPLGAPIVEEDIPPAVEADPHPGLYINAGMAVAIVALIAILIVGFYFPWQNALPLDASKPVVISSPSPTPAITPAPVGSSSPSPVASSSAPIPVSIDSIPWARVTIRPLSPEVKIDPTEQVTPFAAALPPGEYELTLASAQVPQPYKQRIKVVAGAPNRFAIRMPAYDPQKVLSTILGPR